MLRYCRAQLADLTVAEIKQFYRDNSITGYSRYTKKVDLIEYVYSVLAVIDDTEEGSSPVDPIEEQIGDGDQISPEAIASEETGSNTHTVDLIGSNDSHPTRALNRIDRPVRSSGIPESCCKVPARSLQGPSKVPPRNLGAFCEYPANILGLCQCHDPDIPRSSLGHDPRIIDLYPKSSHGFNSIFPGSRINPVPSKDEQFRGIG